MSVLHSAACPRERTQFCLACGARICACHGLGNGHCPVCYRGMLSQYYHAKPCGYKGCKARAVANSPRVGVACLEHATARGGFKGADALRLAEYTQSGELGYYSFTVAKMFGLPL